MRESYVDPSVERSIEFLLQGLREMNEKNSLGQSEEELEKQAERFYYLLANWHNEYLERIGLDQKTELLMPINDPPIV